MLEIHFCEHILCEHKIVRIIIQLYGLKDIIRVYPGVFIYSFHIILKQAIILDFYAKAHFKQLSSIIFIIIIILTIYAAPYAQR